MAPIRVALAGLSASAKTSWAAQGHLPYLLSDKGKAKYELVALLNSSAAAAEAARSAFELPASIKAFGNPRDLAADPDIDLLVVNTRVDVHYDVVKPSLEAGKAAYVEWPLAENPRRAGELTQAAAAANAATMIGLQGRVAPVVVKIAALLEEERIGKVLSSNVQAYGVLARHAAVSEGLSYFTDRKVGGNPITIAFGHLIDLVHDVLGEYEQDAFHSYMQIQRPTLPVIGSDEKAVRTITSDVPDLLSIHGTLDGSKPFLAPNASLAAYYRTGPTSFGAPGLVWTLNGERGEIRVSSPAGAYLGINADSGIQVTSPSGPYLQSDSYHAPVVIEIQDFASGNVERVEWDWAEWQKELGLRSRNVAELYERFAERWVGSGDAAGGERPFPDFEAATKRHEYLEEIFETWDAQRS